MNALITPLPNGVAIRFYNHWKELVEDKTVLITQFSHPVKDVDPALREQDPEAILDWFRNKGYV